MKQRYRSFANEMGDLNPLEQRLVEGFTAFKWLRGRIVITLRPRNFIVQRSAITKQRVFLEQIVVGVYRVVEDTATTFVTHTIDRAVVNAGHDPKSIDGRLYRQHIAKRITLAAMSFNIACAIVNPASLPLLWAYALIWPWYLWRASVERKQLLGA